MLSPDIRFEGFTCRDWQRVLELFRPLPPRAKERDPDRPRGAIVAVHADGKLQKLVHSQVGRLRLDDAARDWPLPAVELAARHDASLAIAIERGALESIFEELGARLGRGDDLTAQLLLLSSLGREQIDHGRIDVWPRRLRGVPIPGAATVERTLDSLCPPGKSILLGLFDKDELWTCIALRRGSRGFDYALGPDALREDLGLLSGDFRRDHRHLARAVTDRLGPLALGCYSDRHTFRRLEVDPTPGAWALAVAVRDVVLVPVPAAMALPLGLDAGRAAFAALRAVAARIDLGGVLDPALSLLREVALGSGDGQPRGFDPLEILRRLLSRDR